MMKDTRWPEIPLLALRGVQLLLGLLCLSMAGNLIDTYSARSFWYALTQHLPSISTSTNMDDTGNSTLSLFVASSLCCTQQSTLGSSISTCFCRWQLSSPMRSWWFYGSWRWPDWETLSRGTASSMRTAAPMLALGWGTRATWLKLHGYLLSSACKFCAPSRGP